MYDNFSFVRTNLRLMKNHWKNKGAPLGGMGGTGLAAYIKATAYVRPRPKMNNIAHNGICSANIEVGG